MDQESEEINVLKEVPVSLSFTLCFKVGLARVKEMGLLFCGVFCQDKKCLWSFIIHWFNDWFVVSLKIYLKYLILEMFCLSAF